MAFFRPLASRQLGIRFLASLLAVVLLGATGAYLGWSVAHLAEEAGRASARVAAAYRRGRVLVTVADDGRGIDIEAIRRKAVARDLLPDGAAAVLDRDSLFELAFRPGFSTRDVVSQTSGRGFGLDVVQASVTALRGGIHLESTPGLGTTFTLDLPPTLAITRALLVRTANQTVALLENGLQGVTEIGANGEVVSTAEGTRPDLPAVPLSTLLGWPDVLVSDRLPRGLLIGDPRVRLAIVVDRVLDEQDLIVKPLGPLLGWLPSVVGGATLADGQVVIVLDPLTLAGQWPGAS